MGTITFTCDADDKIKATLIDDAPYQITGALLKDARDDLITGIRALGETVSVCGIDMLIGIFDTEADIYSLYPV